LYQHKYLYVFINLFKEDYSPYKLYQ
jgi:hypothetical protein